MIVPTIVPPTWSTHCNYHSQSLRASLMHADTPDTLDKIVFKNSAVSIWDWHLTQLQKFWKFYPGEMIVPTTVQHTCSTHCNYHSKSLRASLMQTDTPDTLNKIFLKKFSNLHLRLTPATVAEILNVYPGEMIVPTTVPNFFLTFRQFTHLGLTPDTVTEILKVLP